MIACQQAAVTGWHSSGSCFSSQRRRMIWLAVLIITQLVLYGLLTLVSSAFHYESGGASRPLLAVFAILGAAFLAYLCSIPPALALGDAPRWIAVFFAVAVAARVIVLFSEPIQEVDVYRYIWDGAVSGEGISPYRYRPEEVRQTMDAGRRTSDRDLERLASIASRRDGLREALRRVHFGELPTVYPPVSQRVFRITHLLTPAGASVSTRVRVMKGIMVLFDLGVMLLLLVLLKLLRINGAWCIVYGWSPLIIKEFANSGHLDSIAVFLCLASIVCIAMAERRVRPRLTNCLIIASGLLFGWSVGAKLYPIVLLPLMTCQIWRRRGLRWSIAWVAVACLTTALALWPMTGRSYFAIFDQADFSQPLQGLSTFLGRWEINDLLFMIVEENIRPEASVEGQPHLWFAITPTAWRQETVSTASELLGLPIQRTPFLLTRIVTSVVFAVIALVLCRTAWQQPTMFYEAAFLTLAWFWLLSPTQNPWYWSWALPLVPLARNRLWLLVSGLALIYYWRFWLEYHFAGKQPWGLGYFGVEFFDFVVVWIEFAPFLLLLWLSAVKRRKSAMSGHCIKA